MVNRLLLTAASTLLRATAPLPKERPMLEYGLEHIFSYYITVTFPETVGPVADGLRLNFYIKGGEITGPKLFGKVRPVGADWVTIRRDGIALIDVRAIFETTDGAVIYVTVDGTADLGENGYEQALAGKPPPSPTRYRVFPRFHTAHPQYAWLNRLHCLGIGEGDFLRARVVYDVYAVS